MAVNRYLSINQLYELTGKDRRTITDRLSGVKPHSATGRAQYYDAHEVLPLILVEKTVGNIEKKLQRIELETAQEQLNKLKLANGKTNGELASIEEVAKAVEKEYSFVRAQLRSLPARMAKPLSMLDDPKVVFESLTDAVNECLSELTADARYEQDRQQLESVRESVGQVPAPSDEAKPEIESRGVGGPEEIPQS